MSKKGAKLRCGIRCFFLNAMQWFCICWGPNDFGPTSMKLCWCIFQPAYVSSESGNFSARVVEIFPWSADLSRAHKKIHRDSLFHRSQALLTYLAVEKKACNFNLRTQKFLTKKSGEVGKTGKFCSKKIVVRL